MYAYMFVCLPVFKMTIRHVHIFCLIYVLLATFMFKALHVYVGLPTYILDNICCFRDIYADHICSLVGTYATRKLHICSVKLHIYPRKSNDRPTYIPPKTTYMAVTSTLHICSVIPGLAPTDESSHQEEKDRTHLGIQSDHHPRGTRL